MIVKIGETDFEVNENMTESEIELAFLKANREEKARIQEEVYYGQ